jgi:prohibitin 1
MAAQIFNTIGKLGVGVAIAGSVVNTALYNVEGGHRAVMFDRFAGIKPEVVGEGTHFMIPWVQRPIIYDIRARPKNIPTITGSKDLQNVNITLIFLFRPRPSSLPNFYTTLGQDYDDRVLPSITNEVLKAVVAEFDAGELITQRELVSNRVTTDLTERAEQFGLILDDISITHLTFGREFTAAVEMKQVAQQEAEKARFLVEKAEQVKKASIIIAEGDTEGAQLLSNAFEKAGDGLIELRRIEAAEDIATQMSQSRNIVYLPPGQKNPPVAATVSSSSGSSNS